MRKFLLAAVVLGSFPMFADAGDRFFRRNDHDLFGGVFKNRPITRAIFSVRAAGQAFPIFVNRQRLFRK